MAKPKAIVVSESRGAALVRQVEAWIAGYMFMPAEYALVAALWALNTWIFDAFDAVPYAVITAPTKGSGKSLLGDLMIMVSLNGKMRTDVTKATMFRLLEAHNGRMTVAIDEAEKLRAENHPLREFANTGYRKGSTIPRTVPGGPNGSTVIDFPVFCPKLFILIGDVWDTLRDRSIVFWLSNGVPSRRFRRSDAEREATALKAEIEAFWKDLAGHGAIIAPYEAAWLSGRDAEIWEPLLSIAHAFELPPAKIAMLEAASADMTAAKTMTATRYQMTDADAEARTQDDKYARKALKDLVSIFNEKETFVTSELAVQRMKAIPTGPWRTYKGNGLSTINLSGLLARFPNVKPKQKKSYAGKNADGKWISNTKRGYYLVDLHKAHAGITENAQPSIEMNLQDRNF